MARSKTEQTLYSELKRTCEYYGWWYYKINDAPIFAGNKTRFTQQKPFDLIIATKNETFVIECKVHKKHTAWPLSSIKEHQLETLFNIHLSTKLSAVIFLNVRYGKGKERVNTIFELHIPYITNLIKNNIKSISIDELKRRTMCQYEWDSKEKIWRFEK